MVDVRGVVLGASKGGRGRQGRGQAWEGDGARLAMQGGTGAGYTPDMAAVQQQLLLSASMCSAADGVFTEG